MQQIYITCRLSYQDECGLYHGPVIGHDGRTIPDRPCQRVSDEHLEFWGRVYEDNNLYQQGVRFDYFITAPVEILEAVNRNTRLHEQSLDCGPLLPQQARVARRIELQTPVGMIAEEMENIPEAVCRNGALIEPWHHTTWPRRRATR